MKDKTSVLFLVIAIIIFLIVGILFFNKVILNNGLKINEIEYSNKTAEEDFERAEYIFPSEKRFFKKSDIGTDVFQLTTHEAEDGIFYQEPSYTSPNNKYFLFQSNRDERYRLYIVDINQGEIILLRYDPSFGWAPTWSKEGKVYVGSSGKIIEIDPETLGEKYIDLPNSYVATFLHVSRNGEKILMVEEEPGFGGSKHKRLAIVNKDGSGYQTLYNVDEKEIFYLDHPVWVNDSLVLFLTRGKERNFTGDFNKPHLVDIDGNLRKIPRECSHYDVHPDGDKILCATEGYIINLDGEIIKELPLRGHGVWHPDGKSFLMTGDPIPIPSGEHFGKIALMEFDSENATNIVSHESTYDSTLAVHIQPNAQFSRDGNWIIYESDLMKGYGSDLFIVEIS